MLLISKNSTDRSQSQRCHSLLPSLSHLAIISLEINFKCYPNGASSAYIFPKSFDFFFFNASFKKKNKVVC